jgi:PBP1b-binding outer membrane lipoprotein LpoB
MKKILALILALTIMCFSFVACSDNKEQTPDSQETTTEEKKPESVELTMENFDTYFEFVEESFFTKDKNGNLTQLRFRHYYKLKPEYNVNLEKSTVLIKYDYSAVTKKVDIDFDEQKFTLGDDVVEKEYYKGVPATKISQLTYKDNAILLLQPTHAKKGDTKIEYFDDFKLVSAEGTLHFIEPNVNVEHSGEDHTH